MNVFIRGVFNGSKRDLISPSCDLTRIRKITNFTDQYPIKQCFGSGFSGLLESNPDPGALKKDKKVRLS